MLRVLEEMFIKVLPNICILKYVHGFSENVQKVLKNHVFQFYNFLSFSTATSLLKKIGLITDIVRKIKMT